jgi:molybdenum cofactor cytidylyltransferase
MNARPLHIAGLILAAGESTRMGRDKALLPYRGRTFLETIIARLDEAGVSSIRVVLGYHAEAIRAAVAPARVRVVVNPDYQRGQTSSLQVGLRTLAEERVDGVLLALVDHPAVASETLRALIATFTESRSPVVIPIHQGRRGHPVVIARALFGEILALAEGEGANTVIRRHRAATRFVDVADPGILLDVDDPETYQTMAASNSLNPS